MLDAEYSDFDQQLSARYDTEQSEVDVLTHELLESLSDRLPKDHRYVAIEVSGDDQASNIGRHIERVVFEASFGNDADEMSKEYGPYESASRFFISVDQQTKQASGVLRVITPSESGLKSLDDAIESFNMDQAAASRQPGMEDLSKVWDVGTIAVLPEYREKSGPVSILLERAMYLAAMKHEVQAIISVVDDRALKKMRSRWVGVGIPFKALAGTHAQPYLGSPKSHAVTGYIPEFYKHMHGHAQSLRGRMAKMVLGDALDRLIEGTADDAILLLDDYQKKDA
jgi:hypothetical protein